MALSDSPPIELSEVKNELSCSSMTASKTLGNCHDHVFGSGTRNLLQFLGTGTPNVSSLSASGGNGSIDVTFDLDNNGEQTCTFVAQYWVKTGDANPSPFFQETLGSSSSQGSHNFTISNNISNGNTYEVRVTAYNVFNNDTSNIPDPRGSSACYDFTNTAEATASSPALSTPTLSGQTVDYNGVDYYLEFSYTDSEDDWDVEYRINGGSPSSAGIDCQNNGNPAGIRGTIGVFPDPGDTVEFRVKAIDNGGTDSAFSSWETGTEVNQFSIPSCPV